MLHLAIIGIVCAVSAPIEGTESITQKNNESAVFSYFDGGEPNLVTLPNVYDVVVRNSSDCAGQKVTNRTSSFFYGYIIKQYRDNKNSSCSIMESVPSGKKKKFPSNVAVPNRRKRYSLSDERNIKPKTLRPPLEDGDDTAKGNGNYFKQRRIKELEERKKKCKSDLNCAEKKMFFTLTNPLRFKLKTCKGHKRHLDRLKVDDDLDLNKRIEKLVKEIALENQRKESSAKETALTNGFQDNDIENTLFEEKPPKKALSFPFFQHIKKIFSFSKNYSNNKIADANSVPVSIVRGKDRVSDKAARISSYDLLKTMRKTNRFRRNPLINHVPYTHNGKTVFKNELIEKSFPSSAHYNKKRHFLRHRISKKFISGDRRRRRRNMKRRKAKRQRRKVKTWPLFKMNNYTNSNLRRRRDDISTANSTAHEDPITVMSGDSEAPQNKDQLKGHKKEIPVKRSEDAIMNSVNTCNITNADNYIPAQSVEKPFLERDFRIRDSVEALKSINPITEVPLYPPIDFQQITSKYKYELPNEEYLTPARYLQIRHALRSYLFHNDLLSPVKRKANADRSKRSRKSCSRCRSWRSPPLLCIPYIRKGQEDQLRYIIRIMQSMMGKPFPPKVDIFDRTKFKPSLRTDKEVSCDYLQEDDYPECTSEENLSSESTPNTTPPVCSSTCAPPVPPRIRPRPTCPHPTYPRPTYQRPTYPRLICPRPTCPHPTNPPQTCPPETHPPPTCPTQTRPPPTYPPQTCPPQTYPTPPCLTQTYPTQTCPTQTCPTQTCPPQTCPPQTYPPQTHPNPTTCPPQTTCPRQSYPSQTCPPGTCGPAYSQFPSHAYSRPVGSQHGNDNVTPIPTTPEYTESVPELPFSFPVLGQGFDQTVDDFVTTQSPCQYSATPFCHTPIIPTAPLPSNQGEFLPKQSPSTYSASPANPDYYSSSGNVSPQPSVDPCVGQGLGPESPVEQREYFSFAALSYNGGPGCATETFEYSTAITAKPRHTQPPPFPLCNGNQKFYPQRIACEGCFTNPHCRTTTNPQQQQNFPPPAKPRPSEPQVAKHLKGFPTQLHSDDTFESPNRPDQGKWKPNRPEITPPTYDDQFTPPTEPNEEMKYEITENRLFRMHHRRNPKYSRHKMKLKPYIDYDFYDKYPRDDWEQKEARYNKLSLERLLYKDDYGKPVEEIEKRSKSTRHKRDDDYYSWPESFESYDDYLDEPSDEFVKKHLERSAKDPETWTPPSFDMFSELAKAVTSVSITSSYSNSSYDSTTKKHAFEGKNVTSSMIDLLENNGKTPSKSANETYITTTVTSNQLFLDSNCTTIVDSFDTTSSCNSTENTTDNTTNNTNENTTVTTTVNTTENTTACTTETSPNRTDNDRRAEAGFFASHQKKAQEVVTDTTDDLRCRSDGTKKQKMDTSSHSNSKQDDREDKQASQSSGNEGEMPTTLKMASIARGQKKLVTKPNPKVYVKVYPDSLGDEPEANMSTAKAKVMTTATTIPEKTTPTKPSKPSTTTNPTSADDLKLQILAVCEGYLEVIKLIKAQNQTPSSKDFDMNLAEYCENIISQNFNYQLDKSKKPDESSSQPPNLIQSAKFDENEVKAPGEDDDDIFYDSEIPDATDDSDAKLEEIVKKKISKRKRKHKNSNFSGESAVIESTYHKGKPESGKKKKKKKSHSKRREREHKSTTEEAAELITKGVTQEQIDLINLLQRRKKELLTWLVNSKSQEKTGDTHETEYFNDNDIMDSESDEIQDSGTAKPKRDEQASGRVEKEFPFVNESIFPVYAKQYGYNSGGEVREVEVLWRKINEKTHEKKVFKNVSVLALLLTSTIAPDMEGEDTKLIDSNGYENEEIPEVQSKSENNVGFAADRPGKCRTTSIPPTASNETICTNSTTTTKPHRKNATHTIITKPDVSTIVGKPSKTNRTHSNVTHCNTHKVSHRFGAAKDFFQEYSIEFLNYAVYILPIMFTILFLFCCLCCAVHIFLVRKKHKRKKKKKKKIQISSDDSTETTSECEFESKKRKREGKRKWKSKEENDAILDARRSKKFWDVLKIHPVKANSETNDVDQTEKKKSFLRFLKGKKDEYKSGDFSSVPVHEVDENALFENSHCSTEEKCCADSDTQHHSKVEDEKKKRRKEEEKHNRDGEDEAAERRELIALLEELKKIEMENTEEKKEVKSVHVQYMSQEDENIFKRPEFSYPYEKNVFGLPKGYSFCSKQIPFHEKEFPATRDLEIYDGVNELTELLPCECNYYSKKNDYFSVSREGRCKRFLKVFRDSGMCHGNPFLDKNCRKNESENRTFIFNKYRSINTDEGLMEMTHKNAGTEVRFKETESPFTYRPQNNADLVEEMENFRCQLNKEKNAHLKDDGVLCRL